MVTRKVKIIERICFCRMDQNDFETAESYEHRINCFLANIESHHVKKVEVHDNFAVIEYLA